MPTHKDDSPSDCLSYAQFAGDVVRMTARKNKPKYAGLAGKKSLKKCLTNDGKPGKLK